MVADARLTEQDVRAALVAEEPRIRQQVLSGVSVAVKQWEDKARGVGFICGAISALVLMGAISGVVLLVWFVGG